MEKILFVDDESAVLDGYRRVLFRDFPLVTAIGGEKGLEIIRENGPFAVVISDMRMPGMNGAEFLAEVRKESPITVRMLLTGHADFDSAIEAVNKGNIFRFLTKPCQREVLVEAINSGLEKYRAAVAEKELAKKGEMVGRTDAEWDAEAQAAVDNYNGLAGLPGTEEARSYVQGLFGKQSQCFVVLLKLTLLQTVTDRYGEEAAANYLISAVQFLKKAFSLSDRLFQWNQDTIMAVVERLVRPAVVRMEIQRLLMENQQHVLEVNGRKVMIAYSASFDLLPVAQFKSFDGIVDAFNAKSIGRV
jgi:YesN/AraC family two-component response regulator